VLGRVGVQYLLVIVTPPGAPDAIAAIAGSVVTTGLTLQHQRKAGDQLRRHERHIKLLESGLKAAIDFPAAADRTTHAVQGADTANISLHQSKSLQDEQVYQRFSAELEEARADTFAAVAHADNAHAALRMLIPSAADQARRYLDYCISATAHPDQNKVERHRARQVVEDKIQQALGGDLPDNWMFAEPQIARPRRWKRLLPHSTEGVR
jgi:hypothetical protein